MTVVFGNIHALVDISMLMMSMMFLRLSVRVWTGHRSLVIHRHGLLRVSREKDS